MAIINKTHILINIKVIAPLFIIFIIGLVWYPITSYKVLMGDDLLHVNLILNNSLQDYQTIIHSWSKYRPVFEIPFYYIVKTFGNNVFAYTVINSILNFITAIGVFYFSYKTTNKNIIISFLFSLILIISRFNNYNYLQLLGIMENMAMLEIIAIFILINVFIAKSKIVTKFDFFLVFILFLIGNTHERFLIVLPLITLFYLLKMLTLKKRNFIIFALIPVLLIIVNILIKNTLGVNFFTGAGGTNQSNPLNIQSLLFFLSAVANISGINIGPSYLSGLSLNQSSKYIVLLSFVNLPLLALLLFKFVKIIIKLPKQFPVQLFNICLLICLCLSASISFRQEFRWLYSPFLVLLLFILSNINLVFRKKTYRLIIYIFLFSQIIISVYYRSYLNNIYYMPGINVAKETKYLLDSHISQLNNNQIIIDTDNQDTKWFFINDIFFKHYYPYNNISIFYTFDQNMQVKDKPSINNLKLKIYTYNVQLTRFNQ